MDFKMALMVLVASVPFFLLTVWALVDVFMKDFGSTILMSTPSYALNLADARFVVDKIVRRTTRRNPLPPFITSKLQQEAIRKLRFSAKKTMVVAQQLYEGIDLGPGEPVGLITYMRTDSTRIADEAAQEALGLIKEQFGKAYGLAKPRFFKNKNKAQDAHEAIRPTSVYHTPEKLKRYLSRDQLALYTMIWQRFVASQMAQALSFTSCPHRATLGVLFTLSSINSLNVVSIPPVPQAGS